MEASGRSVHPSLIDRVGTCGKKECLKMKMYIQPPLRRSFKPDHPQISNIPISNETTSKLSFPYPHSFQSSESCKPKAIPHPYDFPIEGITTNSLSYLPRDLPVKEQYPWAMRKYVPSEIKMASDTIYKLSYTPPGEFVHLSKCYNCECL